MSLQGLVSGADCAAPNALASVLKHSDADRSLQQDRVAGPSSSRLQRLPQSASAAALIRDRDAALAQQFFTAEPSPRLGAFPAHAPPRPLQMARAASGPALADSWTAAGHLHVTPPPSARWATEFAQLPLAPDPSGAMAPPSLMPASLSMPAGGMGLGFAPQFAPPQAFSPPAVQGKGKAPAIDFDAAFDALSASLAETALTAPAAEAADAAAVPADLDEFAQYESELQQWMDAQREEGEYDYGVGLQQAWENGLGAAEPSAATFDAEGVPQLGPYVFEAGNPHLAAPGRSFLAEAKALLAAGGSLTAAARLLEAALQRGEPGAGGYEAWLLLGEARSMDEREEQAMQALAEGVRVAAESGAPGAGMLTLAISYTNEGYDRGANALLLRWLRARYPEHPVPAETLASTAQSAWHSTPLVTDAFLALARAQHAAAGAADADVQAALGALLYGRGEYARAGECFAAALGARPGDARLWNRYGSCLSNGAAPEAALGAYREALRLRPAYTRARYNVAVACTNVGAHRQAAEHLLDALAGQGAAGAASEQCWRTLARVLRAMGREDLAAQAEGKPDLELFRREGFDFRAAGDEEPATAAA